MPEPGMNGATPPLTHQRNVTCDTADQRRPSTKEDDSARSAPLEKGYDPASTREGLMRWVRRFLVLLVVLAAGALAATLWMGLEFGEQPTQALTPASDVKFVDANGIHFAYIEEGSGPLVLLFHGYPETARSWSVVQHRLAAAGYRVVAPYMRGYPPSGFAADGNYSVATLGQDVVALIDVLGEQQAVIVGHD